MEKEIIKMENLDYTKYFNPNLDLDKYILPMEESDKNNGLFIRITDKCNKDCTFCLSKNLKTEKDMSIENFKKVCKYYSNLSEIIFLY
jgi:tRNA A37 methylthiotransferase MiaB